MLVHICLCWNNTTKLVIQECQQSACISYWGTFICPIKYTLVNWPQVLQKQYHDGGNLFQLHRWVWSALQAVTSRETAVSAKRWVICWGWDSRASLLMYAEILRSTLSGQPIQKGADRIGLRGLTFMRKSSNSQNTLPLKKYVVPVDTS